MNTIDKILLILFSFLLVFCAAVFWCFIRTGGQEPTALIGAVAVGLMTEIIILFRIKAGKKREDYSDRHGGE